MYHCRCKALTKSGEPYFFTAADIPVKVSPDYFTLANRPGSPLLTVSSLSRAMDHLDLGDGDEVTIDGRPYVVSYYRGFIFQGKSGIIIPSNHVSQCTLTKVGQPSKSRVQFKYNGRIFRLQCFLGSYEGKAVIAGVRELVDPKAIQVSASITLNKRQIFFSDDVDGSEVILWHGRPCIKKEEGYVEIPTGILLRGDV